MNSPCVIELFETIFKWFLLFVYIHKRVPLSQTVELIKHALEELVTVD